MKELQLQVILKPLSLCGSEYIYESFSLGLELRFDAQNVQHDIVTGQGISMVIHNFHDIFLPSAMSIDQITSIYRSFNQTSPINKSSDESSDDTNRSLEVSVGNSSYIESKGFIIDDIYLRKANNMRKEGNVVIYVAIGRKLMRFTDISSLVSVSLY